MGTQNAINLNQAGQVAYDGAGTFSGSAITNHALILGTTGNGLANLTLTNGQLAIGSTGADPSAAALTAGSGIAITNGAGSITVASVGGGMSWTDVTGATQTLAVNNGYVTNRSGGVAYTLPSTAAEGDSIRIAGKLGAWSIAQNALQAIDIGSSATTTGVTGSLASTNVGDCIELLCTTGGTSTIWRVLSSMGNITVA